MTPTSRAACGALFGALVVGLPAALTASVALAAPPNQPSQPLATTPVTDRDYRAVVVTPHAGRVLLVSFWASYCLPCIEELPGLLKLKDKLAKHGADIVFVNADGPGSPAEMMTGVLARRSIALGHTFVVAMADPEPFLTVVDPGWRGQVPFQVLYGKDGARLKSLDGARPLAEIEQAVVAALGVGSTRAASPKP